MNTESNNNCIALLKVEMEKCWIGLPRYCRTLARLEESQCRKHVEPLNVLLTLHRFL